MTNRIIVAICLIIVLGTGYYIYSTMTAPIFTTADTEDGIDYRMEPIQVASPDSVIPLIEHSGNRYTLTPKANYRISGMVVSTQRYRKGYMSWLSPFDYAIIWGNAPDYLPYLKFDQVVRFCLFKMKSDAPVDVAYISSHMGNNHMIPSTPNIRKALAKAQKKDLVTVEGFLAYVLGQDSKKRFSNWNSSLTREDKGNGACEIIYVTKLRINERIYE